MKYFFFPSIFLFNFPSTCNEPVPAEPPKPKFPKKYVEYVAEEAMDWLTNLVDID